MVGGCDLPATCSRGVECWRALELVTRTHGGTGLTDHVSGATDFMATELPDVGDTGRGQGRRDHGETTATAILFTKNLMIECNVIHQAFGAGVKQAAALGKLLHLSARRPRRPMAEEAR